ncbi:MAG: hypothetical protein GC203_13825 [Phenylobacterium sp.]|uniref:hypothetical protein n=1 Tax=Phenylobacterium sp. TaxID=1871053 RepID=UPI0026000F57|nr:hypothetical protein [Phenylobacterium sp.]MBI1198935.1 hypothetical protein [Phenylobacterium sp.]
MIGRLPAVLGLAGLAACTPAPRSASYFEAHPRQAEQVAADCETGAHRGRECGEALAGLAAAQRSARMNAYHRVF